MNSGFAAFRLRTLGYECRAGESLDEETFGYEPGAFVSPAETGGRHSSKFVIAKFDAEARYKLPMFSFEVPTTRGIADVVLGAALGRAEQPPRPADIWSLKLGTPADALPAKDFIDYACGSDGGPPQHRSHGERRRCREPL